MMLPALFWCSDVLLIVAPSQPIRPNAVSEKIAPQLGRRRLSPCHPSHSAQSRVPGCLPPPRGACVKNYRGHERGRCVRLSQVRDPQR